MKFHLPVLLSILLFLSSCNGQNTSLPPAVETAALAGDTVAVLGKSIMVIFQSANGKHWFGGDTGGLYCLDGKTLINYSTRHGLTHNRINGIQEDKHGNIYITTQGGIDKFDGIRFTALTPVSNSLMANKWELHPDDLWFVIPGKNGEKGPCRYDGKNLYQLEFPRHHMEADYFKKYPNNSWSPYDIYYMYKDRKGSMWFGTSNFGVCRFDGQNLAWLYEDHLVFTPKGGMFGIRSIHEDRQGKYWICNTRYRFNVSPGSGPDKNLISYTKEKGIDGIKPGDGTDHVYFLSMAEDSKGDLWLATYNQGVYRYNGKTVTHYDVADGVKQITSYSIHIDKQEGIWLGTHETGAYKFNGTAFEKFQP